jgi:hypothetical protein
MMMTKEEARVAVHAELRRRNLAKPLGAADLLVFCKEMHKRLEFRTQGEALSDIKAWTEKWEALWLRRNPGRAATAAGKGCSTTAGEENEALRTKRLKLKSPPRTVIRTPFEPLLSASCCHPSIELSLPARFRQPQAPHAH